MSTSEVYAVRPPVRPSDHEREIIVACEVCGTPTYAWLRSSLLVVCHGCIDEGELARTLHVCLFHPLYGCWKTPVDNPYLCPGHTSQVAPHVWDALIQKGRLEALALEQARNPQRRRWNQGRPLIAHSPRPVGTGPIPFTT